MTKQEYIEHCRALFENPLMRGLHYINRIESLNFFGLIKGRFALRTKEGDDILVTKEIKMSEDFDDTHISKYDFEQGGKHYKKEG